MLGLVQRRLIHSRLVCLLANSQTADRIGAQLIADLKETHGDNVQFIGAGGPLMQPHFSAPAFWSTDMFAEKPMVPFRTTVAEEYNWWLWLKRNPFTKSYSKPMHEVMALVKQRRILDTIIKSSPNLILTLDHDILSFKLLRGLHEGYSSLGLSRPTHMHWGHFIKNLKPDQLPYLDHVLYTMSIPPRSYSQFVYPHTYLGHQAFATAYRFLLSRSEAGKSLISDDSQLVHKDHFFAHVAPFVMEERSRFRGKHGIKDNEIVLLLAPGNRESEVKWALPKLLDAAREFQSESKLATLTVVLPSTPTTLHLLSEAAKSSGSLRFIVTDTSEDKNSALAGANAAICYNGEIVTECLVNMLPTIVVQNMRKMEFYGMYAWNRFFNDMNIVTDGQQFPEVIGGQCTPQKLCSLLTQYYRSPAQAFWPFEGFEHYLPKMLPVKDREMGMGNFNRCNLPSKLAAEVVWKFATKSRRLASEGLVRAV